MTADRDRPRLIWPEGFDARSEFETPMRGYLSHVTVQLGDGPRYPVFFIDPVRLQQELDHDARSGDGFFAEPGMIVLPEVNRAAIEEAVYRLWQQGYLNHLKPLECPVPG